MSTLSNFLQTRRRLLTWLGGLLLGYALLGFLLIPWIVESQLRNILEDRLTLSAEVDSIYFNPFSFYFEMEQLRIVDPEQDALLHLGRLQLNFQASRLLLLKLQFADFQIADFDIFYARNTEEDDTLSRLSGRWSNTAETTADTAAEPSESSDLIPLEILSLTLSNINTHILDEVPSTPFSTTLNLANAQVNNFSTLLDQTGNNVLSLGFEEDASLDWSGGFTVNPLDFQGEIALNNFSLLPIARYLQDSLPFGLDDGHIDLSFNYDIDLAQAEPEISIDRISLVLNELSATQNGESNPFIEAAQVSLSDGSVSLPSNRAEFDTLTLSNIEINAVRDSVGQINFLEMLEAISTSSATPTAEASTEATQSATPWFVSLASLSIEENRISFVDSSPANTFAIATSIDANIVGIDNQSNTRFALSSNLNLESGGSIELGGELQALPSLELQSVLALSGIELSVIQPYLNEFAFMELESGAMNLNADIAMNTEQPLSINGGVSLDGVTISDQQLNETLFSMTSLGIDSLNLSLADNALDISEVALEDFFARVLINEDGSSNIGRSIKSSSEESATDSEAITAESAADPIAITVGRVSLQNASANFTDLNLPLPFNANIQNLEGSVQGFANNSSQATDINLEGQVDEFGLVQIVSSLNPFDFATQSQIDVNFSNIDMPSMTPYVIKFAGREIAEGSIDLGLSYSLLEGELDANNQLILSELQLGDRVEQAGAMDLPLDLAIALLKDGDGVIDFEIPITGNVNDPEFNFGPAIRRAITNVLTNVVAAPFRLLANLVGGGGDADSLEQIRFLPGRIDIAAPEQEILLKLSEALTQRPQLLLEIPAMTSPEDVPVLQAREVDSAIEAILESEPENEDSLTLRRMAAFENLYGSATLPVALSEIRSLNTPQPETENAPADGPAAAAQLDTLAYIADLRDRLVNAEEIGEADLAVLGNGRKQSIIEFLANSGGIAPTRLRDTEPQVGELDEDGWLILPFGLTTQ